eukprot:Phypoly_transcript_15141.p1 GENE.Phypoly_transcript_15141~~Phypoly_transcript_15141.p1  ORF type:complete len:269 (+),score=38.80 Phypoly_transcript_15141:136-942(+)
MTERTRAICPCECKPPKIFPPPTPSLVNKAGKRLDGRDRDQLRQIFMKTGVIHAATGSAYVELNNTKVICGVYGPKPNTKAQEFSEQGTLFCDFKYTSFSCQNERKGFASDAEEKEYSMLMLQALSVAVRLDKFPKSTVDVDVLVLQNDGAALSTAITCASLALADAGIEMYDLVSACTASATQDTKTPPEGSVVVFDPTWAEEQGQTGRVVLARMPSINLISQLLMDGELDVGTVEEGVDLCIDGCDKLYSMMCDVLVESVQNSNLT